MSIGDNLILVDSQTEFNIKRNPMATKEITNNFELCRFGDEKLKGYFVKDKNDKLIPLEEYNKCCYLVDSGIYNNVYYPIDSFNESYERDYKILLKRIATKIGAKSVSIYYNNEEKSYKKEGNSINMEAQINHPIVEVEANANINNKNSSKEYNKTERNEEMNIAKKEVSKENFDTWLEEEKINIRAFDNIIRTFIDRYYDFGTIEHGEIINETVKMEHNINSHNEFVKVFAGFKHAPTFIKGKFNFDMEKSSASKIEIAKKVKVKIEF